MQIFRVSGTLPDSIARGHEADLGDAERAARLRRVAEAALRTGMSESAVKVGIHRGLKALAELIRRHP